MLIVYFWNRARGQTRRSSDGTLRVSTSVRMASISLMHKYIKPAARKIRLRMVGIYSPLHERNMVMITRALAFICSICTSPRPYASVIPDSPISRSVPGCKYALVRGESVIVRNAIASTCASSDGPSERDCNNTFMPSQRCTRSISSRTVIEVIRVPLSIRIKTATHEFQSAVPVP